MKRFLLAMLSLAVVAGGVWWGVQHAETERGDPDLMSLVRRRARLRRPYGMAPVAFAAFVRACARAKVGPDRITQTIGDDPNSHGYHHRDGTLRVGRERFDYTAATDVHVLGLREGQIRWLLSELAKQGFACWYRHEGKWAGIEHIHLVYAFLPMKWQLRDQVNQFLGERRERGLRPLRWEKKLRRQMEHLRHYRA